MKRMLALIAVVVLLFGCSSENSQMERALQLREKLLNSALCSFDTVVTADYGEVIYTFQMQCNTDEAGNLSFSVTKPDSISGISGIVSADSGKLTYENQILSFSTLAEGQITPVAAPWVFINTLKNGYLRACSETEDGLMMCIDDSYQDDALQLDIWTDANDMPVCADILWQGKRILSLRVSNFMIM